ncbi:hypothetical protein ACI4CU_27305, partial [Klebsiella pneumoniae]|uniref:hypothetical protein n=2 Tax=Klebsiella pneumoniae TaxID=573 RepID=UPI003855166E
MSIIKSFNSGLCCGKIHRHAINHPLRGEVIIETCCEGRNIDEHIDFMTSLSCSIRRQLELGIKESFICMRKKIFIPKQITAEYVQFL